MSDSEEEKKHLSRRRFLSATCGMVAAAGLNAKAQTKALATTNRVNEPIGGDTLNATEPFWGEHQGGILTPVQSHTYFRIFGFGGDQARGCDGYAARMDFGCRQDGGRSNGGTHRAGPLRARVR